MIIVTDQSCCTEKSVVVLGMFDGVHLGHRALLEKGRELADRKGIPLAVCTFLQHPLEVIAPDRAPKLLNTADERAALMEALGVDILVTRPFCTEVMNTLPEDYLRELEERFHPSDVICGYNHTFGKRGAGTPELLKAMGPELGYRAWIIPKITLGGDEVSSTAVRALLSVGNVSRAREMLTYPYSLPFAPSQEGLRCADARKQPLPAGTYRVLCGSDGIPAALTLREDGTALCAPAFTGGEIQFLERILP